MNEDRPDHSTLTPEDADRLAERLKPMWELDEAPFSVVSNPEQLAPLAPSPQAHLPQREARAAEEPARAIAPGAPPTAAQNAAASEAARAPTTPERAAVRAKQARVQSEGSASESEPPPPFDHVPAAGTRAEAAHDLGANAEANGAGPPSGQMPSGPASNAFAVAVPPTPLAPSVTPRLDGLLPSVVLADDAPPSSSHTDATPPDRPVHAAHAHAGLNGESTAYVPRPAFATDPIASRGFANESARLIPLDEIDFADHQLFQRSRARPLVIGLFVVLAGGVLAFALLSGGKDAPAPRPAATTATTAAPAPPPVEPTPPPAPSPAVTLSPPQVEPPRPIAAESLPHAPGGSKANATNPSSIENNAASKIHDGANAKQAGNTPRAAKSAAPPKTPAPPKQGGIVRDVPF